jgi:mannose-1-phosphate guanylyltransferase
MKTVIMAAGFGSRLWPLSTSERPKQFQTIVGQQSLLQHTYQELSSFIPAEELYVLTLSGLEHLVTEQLPGLQSQNLIIVPARRNTLPHVAFALRAITTSTDEFVLFCPVDQLVTNLPNLHHALNAFAQVGLEDRTRRITMFCPKANVLDSSLGYAAVDTRYKVKRFLEKPSVVVLQKYFRTENLYTSSFVFALSRNALLDALAKSNAPEVKRLLKCPKEKVTNTFMDMPFIDISSAVFQYAKNMVVIPLKTDFKDVGTYAALHALSAKDIRGNTIIGTVHVDEVSSNNYIVNQGTGPMVLLDIHNSIVIQTTAGTLISSEREVNKVGEVYKSKIQSDQH